MPVLQSSNKTAQRITAHHHGRTLATNLFTPEVCNLGYVPSQRGPAFDTSRQPTGTQQPTQRETRDWERLTLAVPIAVPETSSTKATPSPAEPKGAVALHQAFMQKQEQLGPEPGAALTGLTEHTCAPGRSRETAWESRGRGRKIGHRWQAAS